MTRSQYRSFVELPHVVHASIVSHLSLTGLLAFSSTCRDIRVRTYPYPAAYAMIKSSVPNPRLWETLSRNPFVAGLVLELTITNTGIGEKRHVPDFDCLALVKRNPDDHFSVVDAMENMNNLRRLSWKVEKRTQNLEHVLDAVARKCTRLEHHDIVDYGACRPTLNDDASREQGDTLRHAVSLILISFVLH
jgi:hypothetical protein